MAKNTVPQNNNATSEAPSEPISEVMANAPANGTREHFAAWQAEEDRREKAEATGSPELVALRKLARTAEHIFDCEGFMGPMKPAEILGEALRCAQSEFAVFSDASSRSAGMVTSMVDSMVFHRAVLRIDLALALAEYRAEFTATDAAGES